MTLMKPMVNGATDGDSNGDYKAQPYASNPQAAGPRTEIKEICCIGAGYVVRISRKMP